MISLTSIGTVLILNTTMIIINLTFIIANTRQLLKK